MVENATQPETVPVKQTIAQKVEELQARKTVLMQSLASLADGSPEKTAAQEEINVIDRKVRWYAGRSKTGKKETASPSKSSGRGSKKQAPASTPAPPSQAPAPAASAANES